MAQSSSSSPSKSFGLFYAVLWLSSVTQGLALPADTQQTSGSASNASHIIGTVNLCSKVGMPLVETPSDLPPCVVDALFLHTPLYNMWKTISGVGVFMMQLGFGLLEAGSISQRNVMHMLMKNVADLCISCIMWWVCGYHVAFGKTSFAMSETDHVNWFFHWSFCATATTIVSGAVAVRTSTFAYVFFSILCTGFAYPLVVNLTWSPNASLAEGGLAGLKYKDFAGSGVVHLFGGCCALFGAALVGPRGTGAPEDRLPGHNVPMSFSGVFLIFFGWFFFNGGSVSSLLGSGGIQATTAIMNTAIAGCTGGCAACFCFSWIFPLCKTLEPGERSTIGMADLSATLNGILAGLVSITASCNTVSASQAVWISALGGGVWYPLASKALRPNTLLGKKIDDPLDAFAVHGACGFWGVIAVAVFGDGDYTSQLVVAVIIIVIAVVLSIFSFGMLWFINHYCLKNEPIFKVVHLLRMDDGEALHGSDDEHHGRFAYESLGEFNQLRDELQKLKNELAELKARVNEPPLPPTVPSTVRSEGPFMI
mmetsp:Transcript_37364/g.68986  ORF Transcript_37364/g.68986 Transcript_37364/m.68986 type:complete len:538 (+) Transcript_37364:59-1672(+)